MANFDKLAIRGIADGVLAGQTIKAGDLQFDTIIKQMSKANTANIWSNRIAMFEPQVLKNSVTLTLDGINAEWGMKLGLGSGTYKSVGGLEQKTAYIANPRQWKDAFREDDLNFLPDKGREFLATKLENALQLLRNDIEMSTFKALAFGRDGSVTEDLTKNKIKETLEIPVARADIYKRTNADNITDALILGAIEFTNIFLPNGILKKVPRSMVQIQLDGSLAFMLTRAESLIMVQKETVVNGVPEGKIANLGGFDVYSSDTIKPASVKETFADNLQDRTAKDPRGGADYIVKQFVDTGVGLQTADGRPVVGFIGTGMVCISPWEIIGTKVAPIDTTTIGDMAINIEARLSGDVSRNENGATIIVPYNYQAIVTTDQL